MLREQLLVLLKLTDKELKLSSKESTLRHINRLTEKLCANVFSKPKSFALSLRQCKILILILIFSFLVKCKNNRNEFSKTQNGKSGIRR